MLKNASLKNLKTTKLLWFPYTGDWDYVNSS